MAAEAKQCSKCRQVLPLSEFYVSRASRDGRGGYCRTCTRDYAAERRRSKGVKPRSVRQVLPPGSTKACRQCHRELDVTEFYISKQNADGFQNSCKSCKNERTMTWLKVHPERRDQIQRDYQARKKAKREQ